MFETASEISIYPWDTISWHQSARIEAPKTGNRKIEFKRKKCYYKTRFFSTFEGGIKEFQYPPRKFRKSVILTFFRTIFCVLISIYFSKGCKICVQVWRVCNKPPQKSPKMVYLTLFFAISCHMSVNTYSGAMILYLKGNLMFLNTFLVFFWCQKYFFVLWAMKNEDCSPKNHQKYIRYSSQKSINLHNFLWILRFLASFKSINALRI